LKRGVDTQIGTKDSIVNTDDNKMFSYPNKYKFDVEKMSPPLNVADGSAKMATKQFWPVLGDSQLEYSNNVYRLFSFVFHLALISMFSLRIATTGMREPHWHPETAEMGYVVKGKARMTILSPGANKSLDTYKLKPGDVYFLPRGYPHHIEAIGSEDVLFLVFFDQPVPGDIGFTGTFSAYSKEVLAATFQCNISQVPNAPFYPQDLLIVHRVNPVAP
jgi:oxalate decarboxylase